MATALPRRRRGDADAGGAAEDERTYERKQLASRHLWASAFVSKHHHRIHSGGSQRWDVSRAANPASTMMTTTRANVNGSLGLTWVS